jgi:flagellar motor switch protein FliG
MDENAISASQQRGRNGVERAAIFLMALGEQAATEVLKHLGAHEVQRVGSVMANMGGISRDEVATILTEFSASVETQTSLGGDEYLRKVMISALGEEKASSIMDRMALGGTNKGLEALKWMHPRAVANLVSQEHPQIVAIVLAYLEATQAAAVLAQFPENLRTAVMMRIATLEGVQPSALKELDEILEKRFTGTNSTRTSQLGGARAAANIMNLLDGSQCNAVLDEIAKNDDQLAIKIQDSMFVFANLIEIDDRGMQELLRGISSERLLLALKGADDRMKEKVFKNMSQRAAEMLKDDLAARGPVKLSDVEAAQKELVMVARKLADAGTIVLGGQGEEYV